jgi:LCP family protein required for cell wall assembly
VARVELAEGQRGWGTHYPDPQDRRVQRRDSYDYDDFDPRDDHDHRGKGKSHWWNKLMLILGCILVVISGGALALLYGGSAHYEDKVGREDILADVPKGDALNFLVLGTDARSDQEAESLDETGSRSDTIMLVHVKNDKSGAFIVSIPRDSYVDIPASGDWAGGKEKINAALSFGGANLAAKTIYNLTKVPLSGAMIVNFNGIQKMVEAVGGVNVCTPFEVRSWFSDKVWGVGCHDMTPEETEEFVRQRMYVPGGDLGRIKNQQNVIKGLMKKVVSAGTLTNPGKMDALLTAAAQALTVDKNTNLRDLAFMLKGIDPANVKFATAPALGIIDTDAGSSVQLDMPAVNDLFAAVRDDKTDEWLAAHPQPDVASIDVIS